MRSPLIVPFLAALLILPMSHAQQSPSPQPVAAQMQPAPCANTPNQGNSAHFKTPNKLKQMLDKQRQQLQTITGVSVPDPTVPVEQTVNVRPVPCPPKASSPASATSLPQAAQVKLPPDVTVTLHCTPITPSPKDASTRPTTLTLPDPHDYAVPRANDFEADSVVPDLASHTPCYLVRIDPKTGKSFVQQ